VDFTYLLRSKITQDEFEIYVKMLGLVLKSSRIQQGGENAAPRKPHKDDPDLWSPTWSVDRIYGIRKDVDGRAFVNFYLGPDSFA